MVDSLLKGLFLVSFGDNEKRFTKSHKEPFYVIPLVGTILWLLCKGRWWMFHASGSVPALFTTRKTGKWKSNSITNWRIGRWLEESGDCWRTESLDSPVEMVSFLRGNLPDKQNQLVFWISRNPGYFFILIDFWKIHSAECDHSFRVYIVGPLLLLCGS